MNTVEMVKMYMQDLPEDIQNEVLDFIIFLSLRYSKKDDPVSKIETQREILQKSFEQLVSYRTFADISDPASWQREIRRDRYLPGREI